MPSKSLSVMASAFLLVAIMDVPAAAGLVNFESEIYPIFAEHCYTCHGPDKQKSTCVWTHHRTFSGVVTPVNRSCSPDAGRTVTSFDGSPVRTLMKSCRRRAIA